MPPERLLFLTGRLAEPSLRQVLQSLAPRVGFEYDVAVLGISVAALLRVDWIRRKLPQPQGFQRVIVPGWCGGNLAELAAHWNVPVERGPKDLFDLPEYFGQRGRQSAPLEDYSIEILAEINHAPRLSRDELIRQALSLRDSGANVIDLGCIPGEPWPQVGDAVRALICEGLRISIDSFEQFEVEDAVNAGAELVLSCHRANLDWAAQVPAELVVIPEDSRSLDSWDPTQFHLRSVNRPYRLDPILEPIGFGFAASLARYYETRRRYPQAAMMMGVGNLTELSEVDSAGINFLCAALCEELQIGSILTTQVINWCRTAVREFDLARRLVRHSLRNHVLPKHLGGQLVMLRDLRVNERGEGALLQLQSQLTDPNFRIFAERGEIHVMNREGYWRGSDPYELFDRLTQETAPLESSHAFYLGMELSKARTALTLGKQYTQDESLRWGAFTLEEVSAVDRRHREGRGRSATTNDLPQTESTEP